MCLTIQHFILCVEETITEFKKSGDEMFASAFKSTSLAPYVRMINFRIVLFIAAALNFKQCFSACARAEYEFNGECCPMCEPGKHVYWHCTADASTTCVPCPASTYTDEHNALIKCYSCSFCDAGRGLYIQSKCTTVRDTICDVLDGYYCIEYSNSKCRHAIKHSVCRPGQETKALGTKSSDTVCVDCPYGFYSPSGLNCIKWTDCTARNEIQTENGSSVKDVTCTPKRRGRYGLIFAVVVTSAFYIILFLIQQSTSCKLKYPVEELSKYNTTHMQHTGENQ